MYQTGRKQLPDFETRCRRIAAQSRTGRMHSCHPGGRMLHFHLDTCPILKFDQHHWKRSGPETVDEIVRTSILHSCSGMCDAYA